MKYAAPSFSVNPSEARAPKDCQHGWLDPRGKCVLCGNHELPQPESVTTRSEFVDHRGRKHTNTNIAFTGLARR